MRYAVLCLCLLAVTARGQEGATPLDPQAMFPGKKFADVKQHEGKRFRVTGKLYSIGEDPEKGKYYFVLGVPTVFPRGELDPVKADTLVKLYFANSADSKAARALYSKSP